MTSGAVTGYLDVGGTKIWDIKDDYPGGAILKWAEGSIANNRLWQEFTNNLATQPNTKSVWWQLCTNGAERDDVASALVVIDRIRSLVPGAAIYVSGQPEYDPRGLCGLAGLEGPARMAQTAAELVSQHGLLAGPAIGPLTNGQTKDGCHPNEAGQAKLGQQIISFFG